MYMKKLNNEELLAYSSATISSFDSKTDLYTKVAKIENAKLDEGHKQTLFDRSYAKTTIK
jgi:hypothetical protein